MTCPHCKKRITTKIEKSFNCTSLFACILFTIFSPFIFCIQACSYCLCFHHSIPNYSRRNNDEDEFICCPCICNEGTCVHDVNHYCSNCGELIGIRNSLKENYPLCARCC